MAHGVEIPIIAHDYATRILAGVAKSSKVFASVVTKAAMATTIPTKAVAKAMTIMAKGALRASKSLAIFKRTTKGSVANVTNLASSVKKLAVAYLGFRALQGMLGGVQKFADAFNTQTAAVNGLAKALQLSGEYSEETMASHKEFASAMQAGANVGDEMTLGLMKQASMLGVSDDQLQNVVKTAIGLSEATGIELNTALKRTVGAMSGVYGELGEVIPAVRNARTEEEKLAAVTEIAAKGFEQKKSSIDSLRGIMTKARNTMGDMMEKIGELLSPILKVVYEGFHVMSLFIQDTIDDLIEMGGGLESIETVARAFVQEVVRRLIYLGTAAQVIFKNFGKVVELAMTYGKLKVLNFVGDVTHFFTVNLPEIFSWFGRNVFNIMRDTFNLIITIVANAVKIIGRSIMAVWDWISSGFEGGFSSLGESLGEALGNGLLDGFESTTEALPELTTRQLSATEIALSRSVNSMTSDLESQFNELLAERMGLLDGSAADAGGLDPLKGGKGTGKEKAANADAFESRLLTRATTEVTMIDILTKISNDTSITAQNTSDIAGNTSPRDGEDETEISLTLINGGT